MSSVISHHDLSDLIGRIYDCTLDPSRWEATLDAIRSLDGSESGLQCRIADLSSAPCNVTLASYPLGIGC